MIQMRQSRHASSLRVEATLACDTTRETKSGSGSNQPHAPQTCMPALAYNDMIMHGNPQWLGDVDDCFRHLDVGLRRRGIA